MKPQITVHATLVKLVLSAMIPIVVVAIASMLYVYFQEQRGFERGAQETARALALVVDREIAKREAVLKTLAASPTLSQTDLSAFYSYAKEIAPTGDVTIVLSDLSGRQLMNTRRPLGSALPAASMAFGEEALIRQDASRVSDLYSTPLDAQFSFAVEVPVSRNGKPLYRLGMGSYATHLQTVLAEQRLPPSWIGAVVDRKGVVVARTADADKFVGKKSTPALLERMANAREGAFNTHSLDDKEVFATFSKSPAYGWGVVIAVPHSEVAFPAQTATLFGVFSLLLLLGAVQGALRVGRKLERPVSDLSRGAEALGRGERVDMEETGLRETDTVGRALSAASVAIRAANTEMEDRVSHAVSQSQKAQRAVVQNQRLEAIGHLTGGVAHDFNNLLMVVSNNLHLLRLKQPLLAQNSQLSSIERAVATGTKLTRQLLAFSRRQALRPEVIDLRERLPDLMNLVRPSLHSGISISCEVAPDTALIEADASEFELALINLAVNARDAMPEKGALIFSARNAEPGSFPDMAGPFVVVEVRDTGRGIDPDVLDKVFEPFFTTKAVGHGTGLGLSQVYGFAVQTGGMAKIESVPWQGTTVRLFLRPTQRSGPADALGTLEGAPKPRLLDARVLLVEDNKELAEVTLEVLTQAGCSVRHVSTGDEARALIDEDATPWDVVLSDIRMPGDTDGIALARHLLAHRPELPIVLTTGYSDMLAKAEDLKVSLVPKPCSASVLLGAIEEALKSQPQRRPDAASPG